MAAAARHPEPPSSGPRRLPGACRHLHRPGDCVPAPPLEMEWHMKRLCQRCGVSSSWLTTERASSFDLNPVGNGCSSGATTSDTVPRVKTNSALLAGSCEPRQPHHLRPAGLAGLFLMTAP